MNEESELAARLSDLFQKGRPGRQIWAGDTNALTRDDYSEREWDEVAAVREKNAWEAPKVELTEKIRGRGFVDCWQEAGLSGRQGPLSTCRFATRIDLVFVSKDLLAPDKLVSVSTLDDKASDHNLVTATFSVKRKN